MSQALVIDDSRAVRMIVGNILREQGFEVVEAVHGQEGLQRLHENPEISLVLVDWNMPEMNGLEFVKTVRAEGQFQNVPLMMVTCETEVEEITAALAAGANEYVMKPFYKEVIADKLQLLGF